MNNFTPTFESSGYILKRNALCFESLFLRLSHKDNMSDFHLNNKEEETCRPETALIWILI